MLLFNGYLVAFLLGLATAALGSLQNAAWWQMLLLALFLQQIHKHHFHGIAHQVKLGWLFGFGYFCVGIWWLYISLHDIGGMPAWMACGAVIILSAFLAIFPTLAVAIGARFYNQSYSALAWGSAWTITEWLRATIFTGFPWIGFGDAQINGPFQGLIPLLGVLGATFATIWGAYKIGSAPSRFFLPLFSLGFVVLISSSLEGIQFTQPIGRLLEVRLLQGNFPQTLQYDPAHIERQNQYYLNAFVSKPADLTVGPETAFPILENAFPKEWEDTIQASLKATQGYLLTGIIGTQGEQYSNRAKAYGPEGTIYHYDKTHLVPFGEYIPPGFEWFVKAIKAPLSQFKQGLPNQENFIIRRDNTPNISAAIMICYEDVFGSEIAQRIRDKATTPPNLLINLTNLAWFGDTQAPWQHLRLAQLRSLETGLPTVRSTNTGVTAIIDEQGRVTSQLPVFTEGVLTGSVQARTGITPYVRLGDLPILLICFWTILFAWRKKRRLDAQRHLGTALQG